MPSRVYILIGDIASGKSTWCRTFAREQGVIIVNDDAIVTSLHGGQYDLYSEELKPLYKATELSILQSAITLAWDVAIDRSNYSKSMRRKYIGIAKSFGATVVAIIFPKEEPVVHAQRRIAHDPRGRDLEYWIKAVEAHRSQWEPASMDEGFDEMYTKLPLITRSKLCT